MAEIYASVDLGGTNIACIFAGADGRVVGEKKAPTQSHEGPQAVLARIAELVNCLAAEYGNKPAALGMGIPGLADLKSGVTKFLPNLPTQWRDVPVRGVLAPKVGCPVYLLNDVRMATLGELVFGARPNVAHDGVLRAGHRNWRRSGCRWEAAPGAAGCGR